MKEQLKVFLQDITLGQIQTIGPITVVPLVSEKHFTFSAPMMERVSNSGYGHLKFQNVTDEPMLIPAQTAFLSKGSSQDHATMEGLVIKPKSEYDYRKAICVEQRQGGYMTGAQEKLETTLPLILREKAFESRNAAQGEFGRLWSEIAKYNQSHNIRSGDGHYSYFMQAYGKVMDEFVAEFEMVYNQVGFIVFAKNRVYGIERFPSPGYLKRYYRSLMKGCYGAVILDLLHTSDEFMLKDVISVPVKMANTVDGLIQNLKAANQRQDKRVKDIITDIVFGERGSFDLVQPAEQAEFLHYKNDYFIGNVLSQTDGYPYFTFIALQKQLESVRKGVEFKV